MNRRALGPQSAIAVQGWGVVSPAGWGVEAFREALAKDKPLPPQELARPGWPARLKVRRVPPPLDRAQGLLHARLRRSSPISQFAASVALEALGEAAAPVSQGTLRLGIVCCVMSGCVQYTRRFFEETLRDPVTASPLVFPETVFNAPASHLAGLFNTPALNYTLVGDSGMFLQGLALGGGWLAGQDVDACLIVASEEADWLTADAFRRFARRVVLGEGAGALCLRRAADLPSPRIRLEAVSDAWSFGSGQDRLEAAQRARAQMPTLPDQALLCDGTQGLPRFDAPELEAWRDWPGPRLAVKQVLGEGLAAGSAWQCVAAVDSLAHGSLPGATVSVVGANQQAIACQFRVDPAP